MINELLPISVQKVLEKLKILNPQLLGKGGEGYVFSYKEDLAIKIYINPDIPINVLEGLKELHKLIANYSLPFATPEILEIGSVDTVFYTIEKKLHGITMEEKFPLLYTSEKIKLIENYYDVLKLLNKIELPNMPYGNILETPYAVHADTYQNYLTKVIDLRIAKAEKRLRRDVKDLHQKVDVYKNIIQKKLHYDKKHFVHGDYFTNNVLVNESNQISAVLDIGIHSVVGDPRQDIATIVWLETEKDFTKEDSDRFIKLAAMDYGEDIQQYIDIYKIYTAIYFSELESEREYSWIVNTLNDNNLWKRIT